MLAITALCDFTAQAQIARLVTVAQCASSHPVAIAAKDQNSTSDSGKVKSPTRHHAGENQSISLDEAIKKSHIICKQKKEELGSPGLVVCVSVDGMQVYANGFGYSDLENQVPVEPDSVMRIASISKSITSLIVAKMWEESKIDLDKKVQHYIPDFPQKYFMGEKVDITVSQLLNHTSGIRHYKKKNDPANAFDDQIVDLVKKTKEASLLPFYAAGAVGKKTCLVPHQPQPKMPFDTLQDTKEKEIYSKTNFPTTAKSLELFQNDPLVSKPGTKFVYTTHGFTLLSAIVEAVAKQPFSEVVTKTFHTLGMERSYLDKSDPIIYKRARNYQKDKIGRVVNCPYVDNSYKWAGGGLLSTTEDLVKFGNILLYSAEHQDEDPSPPGYLKASTVWKFWSPPPSGGRSITPRYGLGFELTPEEQQYGMCGHHSFGAGHTGNAVGASSVLFILPRYAKVGDSAACAGSNGPQVKSGLAPLTTKNGLPQGVVVAIIVNLPSIDLRAAAKEIAKTFEKTPMTQLRYRAEPFDTFLPAQGESPAENRSLMFLFPGLNLGAMSNGEVRIT
ncbi:serine beta-lactamase-like protein LACTB, mitochondrial [Elysia marginata]|uniref:Serine beta-lactamase-like protein LACTB, mitochondrial n=1 Tax=Elysia marginata TaxID=1093978 RepID=A0AAV4FLH0_9GAST|nr:serine beta-lactamase-like protein LACTB, mitochondrial [Elysia marginata]